MIELKWSTDDFESMGWHDCRLYGIKLPGEKYDMVFDIDYISRWIKSNDSYEEFEVSPCSLMFSNVSDLNIELNYKDTLTSFIMDILRKNKRMSPNGKMVLHDYTVQCNIGFLSFSSTGFEQIALAPPARIENQDLMRSNLVIT